MKWRRDRDDSGLEALQAANRHLAEAQAQWPEVRRVAASLRELRERNNFAESIELVMRGGTL